MKVLLQVPLSTYSGYGNDGIGLTQAMLRAGIDVYLMPTVVQAPIPDSVASLLTKETKGPFDLVIQHVDPMNLNATPEIKASTDMLVGWSMWEYSNLGNAKGRSKFRSNWKKFDAMVGYDSVSVDCLADHYAGPVVRQQGGFDPSAWPYVERDWHSEDFYFCQIGVLSERKDPFVSIQAFGELKAEHEDFDKHARLMMKTSTPGLHSKMEDVYPGLRIFYDTWPVDVVKEFYRQSHVLLAPSRGEGKNMPALEFMSTGGTVIATNWGGHTEWLHPDYAYPIDYTLEPCSPQYKGTFNARASVEHMKAQMLHAFRNREDAKRKGEVAAQVIPNLSSWDNVLARLIEKLAVVPGGAELKMKFDMARREVA